MEDDSFPYTFLGSDVFENFDFDKFLVSPCEASLGFCSAKSEADQVKPSSTEKKQLAKGSSKPRAKRRKIEQIHVCNFHQPRESIQCFGTFSSSGKYKGARCKRMVSSFLQDQLPVCSHHRRQIMKMVKCEALLHDCGLPCGAIIPWEPHSYPLCPEHWSQGERYFERLPVEIRLMIYDYLIPDKRVPAVSWTRNGFRADGGQVSTALFRVSHSIHEEFADVFYGKPTFEVEIRKNWESTPSCKMCCQRPWCPPERESSCFQFDIGPWVPPIPLRYFERIRSFHVNISIDNILKLPRPFRNPPDPAATIQAEAEKNHLCDELHRFAERVILSNHLPLRHIGIEIRVEDQFGESSLTAGAHCQALLNPVRCLLARPTPFFLVRTNAASELRMIPECSKPSILINVKPLPPVKQAIIVRFGQLAQLLNEMGQHPFWRRSDVEQMEFLLSNARAARESGNMEAMRVVCTDVFKMLQQYNDDHRQFMLSMKSSFESIGAVVLMANENRKAESY